MIDSTSSSIGIQTSSGSVLPATRRRTAPAVTFDAVTFSDGTTVELEPNDVIVFVGPNNAGKSLGLRELEAYIGGNPESKVIIGAQLAQTGTPELFECFLRQNLRVEPSPDGNQLNVAGLGVSFGIGGSTLAPLWPGQISLVRPLFCRLIKTESRINDSDPVNSIDLVSESASHPMHLLYDDRVEARISEYFRQAFGTDLIFYRGGGRRSRLLVGERLAPETGEDRISASYLERLVAATQPLEEQGDGLRSFASVILHLLAPLTPSVLLLDEPEAFLHPPQARLLGEVIAKERPARAQLFVATHSADVLQGLVAVAPEHLKVIRIQRDGNQNRVKQLDKELVKSISTNPLMRYSSVLSGVFHERVIICEADADCMFYSSILDNPNVYGDRNPDVLFVRANGKHTVGTLARALRSLDVPVDVIVDMDVLNDTNIFKGIVDALGGNWSSFEDSARALKAAVEEQRPSLSTDEVKKGIKEVLNNPIVAEGSLNQLRAQINAQFRMASPWEHVKSAGEQALPQGEAVRHFRILQSLCKDLGLWIVPVGQLERFCTSVGGYGPSWVQQVMEQLDPANSPELERARTFVKELWDAKVL